MNSWIWENKDSFKKNKRKTLIKKWYSNLCAMKSSLVYALSKTPKGSQAPFIEWDEGMWG